MEIPDSRTKNARQFSPDSMLPYVQSPQGELAVELASLEIQARITGVFAETTQTLRIYNPNNRDLEGNVCLPLPDGAVVCAYALDIGGKLVDGVVVAKQKARKILEAEERKGVDPGLVEHVQGNIYRTRVYPIAARGYRTVRIIYVSDLSIEGDAAAYHLPLVHAQHISEVTLRVEVAQSPVEPVLTGGIGNMSLRHAQHRWVAEATLVQGTPTNDLHIRLPGLPNTFSMLEKTQEGETFFCVSSKLPVADTALQNWIPKRIGIAWDASGSRINNIQRDLDFLTALFTRWPKTLVDLVIFRDVIDGEPQLFDLGCGDGEKLVQLLQDIPYDGGTKLNALNFTTLSKKDTEAWFLFSDGMATINSLPSIFSGEKLYAISCTPSCNSSLLAFLAESSGGLYINLLRTNSDAAITQICQRAGVVTISQQSGCESSYIINNSKRFTAIGKVMADVASISVTGPDALNNILPLRKQDATTGNLIARAWAGMEARSLIITQGEDSEKVVALGRSYGLVTPGTSLLVLENISQYLEYEVEPPASLEKMRDEYHRVISQRTHEKHTNEDCHIQLVLQWWEARTQWWLTEFDYKNIKQKQNIDTRDQRDPFLSTLPASSPSADFIMENEAPALSRSLMKESRRMRDPGLSVMEEGSAAGKPDEGKVSAQANIAIKPWSPDTPYLATIRSVAAEQAYSVYLQQRECYANSPSFILDCSDYFLTQKMPVLGMRILSNLLEQGLDDVALMRIYGWRLQQAESLDLAVEIFERVLKQREDEPQSHRDLALALVQRWEQYGNTDDAARAMALFYAVIIRQWNVFPEIEIIALMEMNRLIHLAKKRDIVIPERIDKRLLRHLDLDVRISMSWDADLTDVDLHVFEPSGEHAYYGHNRTEIGGLVSRDFTRGYGPEEYVLKRAMPGNYIIKAHYYGSHQQTLCGPCTVTVTVFTNFGRDTEKKQTLTLRLDKPHNEVVVGEVTIEDGMYAIQQVNDTLYKFRLLRKGMSVDEIVQLLGQPIQITGSTQLLMIYRPDSLTEIQLTMTPLLSSAQQITRDTVFDLLV